jgi:hypothetical protein
MVDARRAGRNAIIVTFWVVVTVSGFIVWAQRQSNLADPTGASHGGPNVYPPGTAAPPVP